MSEEKIVQELIENLFVIFKSLRKGIESDSEQGEITMPQAIVMKSLFKCGALSMKELSQKVDLSHSTVSGIIDRLEIKGLVKRTQDQEDRRITKVMVTKQVDQYGHSKMHHRMFAGLVDAFKGATAEEQRKVIEGFTILRQLIEKKESN